MRYLIPILMLSCCFAAANQEPVEEPSSEVTISDETGNQSDEVGVHYKKSEGCGCSDKGKNK